MQTNKFVSKPANRVSQSALRILKWIADGPSPNVHELRQRLQLEKIEISLIQETKLISKDPTPAFPGFSAIRQNCPSSHSGGELLTLVKEGVLYQRIARRLQATPGEAVLHDTTVVSAVGYDPLPIGGAHSRPGHSP